MLGVIAEVARTQLAKQFPSSTLTFDLYIDNILVMAIGSNRLEFFNRSPAVVASGVNLQFNETEWLIATKGLLSSGSTSIARLVLSRFREKPVRSWRVFRVQLPTTCRCYALRRITRASCAFPAPQINVIGDRQAGRAAVHDFAKRRS